MYSIEEISQNKAFLDFYDLLVEFRLNNQLRSCHIDTIEEVFMGDKISLKEAIDQEKTLHCFIDVGEELESDFTLIGSVSLTWTPEENNCYIGTIWIEPEFRGNGLATYILNEIINFADELGIILALHAIPFIHPKKKPTDEEILKMKDYYRKFGFKENSETKGIGFDCLMERYPTIKINYI